MTANTKISGTRRGNPWRMAVWGAAACLLLLPLIAMQFTEEVNWTAGDFIVMGLLLAFTCGVYELGTRLSGNTAYRAAFGLAVVGGFVLVWINLAVGIIGSEDERANLLFVAVLLVGIIGAILARFEPRGMARALMATTLAQALVAVIALFLGSMEGALLSGFFAAVWLGSSTLFGKAATELADVLGPEAQH